MLKKKRRQAQPLNQIYHSKIYTKMCHSQRRIHQKFSWKKVETRAGFAANQ
ncbi:UNVERIFIED_CONTAM: hypothetical protein GTU68_062288 [Idotea baltica]|nr:hypothetical protein [Idotea baltica]